LVYPAFISGFGKIKPSGGIQFLSLQIYLPSKYLYLVSSNSGNNLGSKTLSSGAPYLSGSSCYIKSAVIE